MNNQVNNLVEQINTGQLIYNKLSQMIKSSFVYQTQLFCLGANITDNQMLQIRLQDKNTWTSYRKLYTQSDSGSQEGEIHKKVQIQQLYYSLFCIFQQSKIQQQENLNNYSEHMHYMQSLMKKYSQYTGKYLNPSNMSGSATLTLNAIREYRYGEILKYNGHFPCYKVEQGGTMTIYVSKSDIKTNKQKIYQSRLKLNKQNQLPKQYIEHMKQRKQRTQFQLKLLQEICILKSLQNRPIHGSRQHGIQSHRQSVQMSGLPQPNLSKFSIEESQIKYIGENNLWTHFIFNQIIPFQTIYTFKIRVVESAHNNIMVIIGIADYARLRNQANQFNSGHAISYGCINGCGYRFPGLVPQKLGFKQGDTIEVSVNLGKSSIQWSVSGNLIGQYTHEVMGNKQIVYMPYFQTNLTNTTVEWVS